MMQNRKAVRKECLAKVQVSWQSSGRKLKIWGMVQDKSKGGLGVQLPNPIDVGSVVALAQGFSTSFGIVKHCAKIKGKFFIGVEFCALENGVHSGPSSTSTPANATTSEDKNNPAAVGTGTALDAKSSAELNPNTNSESLSDSGSNKESKPSPEVTATPENAGTERHFRQDFAMLQRLPK